LDCLNETYKCNNIFILILYIYNLFIFVLGSLIVDGFENLDCVSRTEKTKNQLNVLKSKVLFWRW